MGVMRISAHSLTSDVGIGSRPQDLDGEDFRILSRLSSDTGVKEDSVFLVELGLVTEDGVDDCSVDLILRILSEKNLQKVFARSVLFVQSGRTATEDLCNNLVKNQVTHHTNNILSLGHQIIPHFMCLYSGM